MTGTDHPPPPWNVDDVTRAMSKGVCACECPSRFSGWCLSIFRRVDDVTRAMSKGTGGGACECLHSPLSGNPVSAPAPPTLDSVPLHELEVHFVPGGTDDEIKGTSLASITEVRLVIGDPFERGFQRDSTGHDHLSYIVIGHQGAPVVGASGAMQPVLPVVQYPVGLPYEVAVEKP